MSDTPAEAEVQAKPKPKAKPPKPEDKPFEAFMREEFLPAVGSQLKDHAIAPDRLELVTGERPVVGGTCPMVVGELPGDRRFWLWLSALWYPVVAHHDPLVSVEDERHGVPCTCPCMHGSDTCFGFG